MNNTAKGFLLAALAGATWGTYGTFVSLLGNYGFSETAIAALAPIMLIVLFFISAMIRNPKCLIPTKKQFLIFIIVGIIGVLGTNLCYAAAISAGVSVGIASVITFTNYFLVMVISRVVWKVKITAPKIGAGILAVVGIFMLIQAWTGLSMTVSGLLLIIVVTMTFAISYCLLYFSVNDLQIDPDAFYMWINLIGFILLCFISPPWSIWGEITASISAYGTAPILLALLGFGLIPQLGSYFFLGRAFLHIEPPLVVIMFSLDPIVASILGYFVLGQVLAPIQLIGMAVILAALIWLQLVEWKTPEAEQTAA
ncbi:MAG: DMT family transporter [Dehalobacterium sp.]